MADLTRREIAMMADEFGIADYPAAVRLVRRAFEVSRSARAALAADGPAVPEGREPASVVGESIDVEQVAQQVFEAMRFSGATSPAPPEWVPGGNSIMQDHARDVARAILTRWGHQPAPPVGEEVAELVARLRRASDGASAMGWEQDSWVIARAADLLTQRHPEPVPVAERPWEREGWCDDEGRCWWTAGPVGQLPLSLWLVSDPAGCTSGVMLPANALPLPAGEVGHG